MDAGHHRRSVPHRDSSGVLGIPRCRGLIGQELGEIRSYSNWSLKGVKHQNFARVGEEYGVALKVKGMRVVTISSGDHETLFARIPVESKEEQHA